MNLPETKVKEPTTVPVWRYQIDSAKQVMEVVEDSKSWKQFESGTLKREKKSKKEMTWENAPKRIVESYTNDSSRTEIDFDTEL